MLARGRRARVLRGLLGPRTSALCLCGLLLLSLLAAPDAARATTCSAGCQGLVALPPVIQTGQTVDFLVIVENDTTTVPVIGGTPVQAELDCLPVDPNDDAEVSQDGACCLRLACPFGSGVSECLVDDTLIGTFSIDSVSAPLFDDVNVTTDPTEPNRVCVSGPVSFDPEEQLLLFTVTATAQEPVLTDGGNFTTAFDGPNSIRTDVVISNGTCNEPPGDPNAEPPTLDGTVRGQCGVSAPSSYPPTCAVEVDKQVSCDGGATWFDAADASGSNLYVTMNEDGTNDPCLGWNGEDVDGDGLPDSPGEPLQVRYRARNVGDQVLESCLLVDDNSSIPPVAFPGDIDVEDETVFFGPPPQLCSPDLDAMEPDTASVQCSCTAPDPDQQAMAFDSADFECQTPGAAFVKTCNDLDGDGLDDTVLVTAGNTGTATLASCAVVDVLDADDPSTPCEVPPLDPSGIPLDCFDAPRDSPGRNPVNPANFGLSPAGEPGPSQVFCEGPLPPAFEGSGCNRAVLECEVAGAGKLLLRESEDVCRVFECPEPTLDKQVDAGSGYVDCFDDGFGDCRSGVDDSRANEQAVEGLGWNGEAVTYRYVVDTVGGVASQIECSLTDDVLGPIDTQIVLAPGDDPVVIEVPASPGDLVCGTEFQNGVEGQNTATLSCVCTDPSGTLPEMPLGNVQDRADLACQQPDLEAAKACTLSSPPDAFDFDIMARNSGEATLINCVVYDEVVPGECPDEPAAQRPPSAEFLGPLDPPVLFPSDVGSRVVEDRQLPEASCNTAWVECEISDDGTEFGSPAVDQQGQPKRVVASAQDECDFCSVSLDKQVDAGQGFQDVSSDDDPGNLQTITAVGWNAYDSDGDGSLDMPAEDVAIDFVIENTGMVDVVCTLTDNGEPVTLPDGGSIPAGSQPVRVSFLQDTCRDEIEGTDTAELSCECVDGQNLVPLPPLSDSAAIECQTPDVGLVKTCEASTDPEAPNDVTICDDPNVCRNAGDATLVDCVVEDPGCTPDAFQVGTLAPGQEFGPFQCTVPAGTAENEATLTCGVLGSGGDACLSDADCPSDQACGGDGVCRKTITRSDLDPCESCPEVAVDKQIDAGAGFQDVTGDDDPDGTVSVQALGWNAYDSDGDGVVDMDAEGVAYQYRVTVEGGVNTKVLCDLEDDRIGVIFSQQEFTPPFDQVFSAPDGLVCSGQTPSGEVVDGENTATLSCACLDEASDETVSELDDQTDSVDLDCQTPDLGIDKVCGFRATPDDPNPVVICDDPQLCQNSGTATLVDCVVEDPLCDPASFDVGTLEPGQSYGPFECLLPADAFPEGEARVNEAFITCGVLGSGGATCASDAECPADQACGSDSVCRKQVTRPVEVPCQDCPPVRFDKQVDAGSGFVDISLPDDPGGATDDPDNQIAVTTEGWNAFDSDGDGSPDSAAEPVRYRYRIEVGEGDPGTQVVCDLVDDKLGTLFEGRVFNPGEGVVDVDDALGLVCSGDTPTGETVDGTNTATLSCACQDATDQTPIGDLGDLTDSADLDCQTPDAALDKECAPKTDPAAANQVTICALEPNECLNGGTATLIECVVEDEICNPSSFDVGTLEPGQGFGPFQCEVAAADLPADATNRAVLNCLVDGSGGDACASDAECPSGQACDAGGSCRKTLSRPVEALCPSCPEVGVDKQVDAGSGFVDVFGSDDDPQAEAPRTATGWNAYDSTGDGQADMAAEAVRYRYQVSIGDSVGTRVQCSLVDDKLGTIFENQVFDPNTQQSFDGPSPLVCNGQSPTGETVVGINTATLSCACLDGETSEDLGSLDDRIDRANLDCLTPDARFSKLCEAQVDGLNRIVLGETVDIENTGTADLVNCQLDDPPIQVDGQSFPVVKLAADGTPTAEPCQASFALASGAIAPDLLCGVADLPQSADNQASLACDVLGASGKRLTRSATDECEVAIECPDVEFDKQVAADGGAFRDVFGDDDDPADEQPVQVFSTDTVDYQYVVRPVGDQTNTRVLCNLSDDILGPITEPFELDGEMTFPVPEALDPPLHCGEELATGNRVEGVNTATLSCACLDLTPDTNVIEMIEKQDRADVSCEPCELEIDKTCCVLTRVPRCEDDGDSDSDTDSDSDSDSDLDCGWITQPHDGDDGDDSDSDSGWRWRRQSSGWSVGDSQGGYWGDCDSDGESDSDPDSDSDSDSDRVCGCPDLDGDSDSSPDSDSDSESDRGLIDWDGDSDSSPDSDSDSDSDRTCECPDPDGDSDSSPDSDSDSESDFDWNGDSDGNSDSSPDSDSDSDSDQACELLLPKLGCPSEELRQDACLIPCDDDDGDSDSSPDSDSDSDSDLDVGWIWKTGAIPDPAKEGDPAWGYYGNGDSDGNSDSSVDSDSDSDSDGFLCGCPDDDGDSDSSPDSDSDSESDFDWDGDSDGASDSGVDSDSDSDSDIACRCPDDDGDSDSSPDSDSDSESDFDWNGDSDGASDSSVDSDSDSDSDRFCKVSQVSARVEYRYQVTNRSSGTVTNVAIEDDVLGTIAQGGTLEPDETAEYFRVETVKGDVTNTATVTGELQGAVCEPASDSVFVGLEQPNDKWAPVMKSMQVLPWARKAQIDWKTDEPSRGTLSWARKADGIYTDTMEIPVLAEQQSIVVEGLDPDTEYNFRIDTEDAEGNASFHDDDFRTDPASGGSCGLGAELALLMPPLMWVWRKRKRCP